MGSRDNWHKNAEADEQYVFAMHPHGVVSLGVWANIISNGGGLYDALPGLNLRVVTLSLNFFIPVWREIIMALGIIDSSEKSITAAFDRQCSVVGFVLVRTTAEIVSHGELGHCGRRGD